ncbi:MAG: ABC transporter permease [candidate division Zixibacteria bacterium CG_4_9_14_3_um_filter_46_8]|nr:MAG: ABC transporter permease [candidate division Zixibacteria bacterium CG_4_9_14_3_um_filter_46_8]
MVKKSSGFLAGAAAVLIKDITSEFRTRYAINALVMFSLVTLTVVSIAIGRSNLNYDLAAAFLWVIIFFSAISGLGQSFIKEEEARTIYALRLYANPLAVFAGKFIFNSLLLLFLELIFVPLFFILLAVECGNILLLFLVILLGSLGLTGATTIIAAIIAKASVKGALFAVLSFPILLPLLVAAIGATEIAFSGGVFADAVRDLKLLVSYPVIMMTASTFLFEFIWNE